MIKLTCADYQDFCEMPTKTSQKTAIPEDSPYWQRPQVKECSIEHLIKEVNLMMQQKLSEKELTIKLLITYAVKDAIYKLDTARV